MGQLSICSSYVYVVLFGRTLWSSKPVMYVSEYEDLDHKF